MMIYGSVLKLLQLFWDIQIHEKRLMIMLILKINVHLTTAQIQGERIVPPEVEKWTKNWEPQKHDLYK